MNIEDSLRAVAKTGKVSIGSRLTLKHARSGSGRLYVISKNCHPSTKDNLQKYSTLTSIPIFVFSGSSIELGSACKKPFPISALTVFEPGDSDILGLLKQ